MEKILHAAKRARSLERFGYSDYVPPFDPIYPESDGKPVGETDYHISVIFYLRAALRYFLRQVDDVYVAADMLFYYVEGQPRRFKVPDVFVVKGISKHNRRIYKLWEEQIAPCAIFEITSRSTSSEDTGTKFRLYESWGVNEYFLFDPLDEYLKPRLQGFRLNSGQYERIELAADGTLYSQELGLILLPDADKLRLVDPRTGQQLPTLEEASTLMSDALEHAEEESRHAEEESRHAEEESRRAEEESRHAEEESRHADRAEAEIVRLRTLLAQLRGSENRE